MLSLTQYFIKSLSRFSNYACAPGLVFLIFLSFFKFPLAHAQALEPNEMGLIPVLEYHRLGNAERSYTRSVENFKNDLEWLYNNDYVLVTVEDFMSQKIAIPIGKKPVMMTFDDSTGSQFTILPDGTIDPDSAIGIMDAFYEKHRDFGRTAMFFVNSSAFEQKEFKKKKLDYLLATGREIGNHTISHGNLAEKSPGEIEADLGSLQEFINTLILREVPLDSLAFPFGAVPKTEEGLKALQSGNYNDTTYSITAGFLVGADPSHPPYSTRFDPLRIARIQAIDEEWQRWFGRAPGQTGTTPDSELFTPFVSDGCQDLLVLPEKRLQYLDKAKVREGLEICVSGVDDCAARIAACEKIAEDIGLEENVPENFVQKNLEEDGMKNNEKVDENSDLSGSGNVASTIQQGSGSGSTEGSSVKVDDFGIFKRWLQRGSRNVARVYESMAETIPRVTFNKIPEELSWDLTGFKYTVQAGDTLGKIAEKFLQYTEFYLGSQFKEAFVQENGTDVIEVGGQVVIPSIELIIYNTKMDIPDPRGVYWTAYSASSQTALKQIELLREHNGNAVVFDVKEIDGYLFYDSKVPLALKHGLVRERLSDIPKLVRTLHRNGIYAIARIVAFKDIQLLKARPDLAPISRSSGRPWGDKEGTVWADPSKEEVQEYVLAVAEEIARLGVDEIQFDYIRFPATGTDKDAKFDHEALGLSREDVIVAFLEKAHERLKPYGVKMSADLFGVVAWNNGYDGKIVGQDVARMAEPLDTIYPMVYPSHFAAGFGGRENPGGEPYYFVSESMKKFIEQVDGKAAIIPWIQGFSWGATGYGTGYIQKQIQAAEDLGVNAYLIWNAANNYDLSWGAM